MKPEKNVVTTINMVTLMTNNTKNWLLVKLRRSRDSIAVWMLSILRGMFLTFSYNWGEQKLPISLIIY